MSKTFELKNRNENTENLLETYIGEGEHTMKLGSLVYSRDIFETLYTLKLKNGLRALKLKKLIAKINEELKNYEELKNEFIRASGKQIIKPEDAEYADISRKLNEALSADLAFEFEKLIEEEDLEGSTLSAADIDVLVAFGLISLS